MPMLAVVDFGAMAVPQLGEKGHAEFMDNGEQPLPDEEVRTIARSLWRGIEQASRKLARKVHVPGSVSDTTLDADVVASQIVFLNLLAAADHARTLASVLKSTSLGPSSATLARGCLETLARIHWITNGASSDDVRARVLAVLHGDVDKSAHSSRFAARDRILSRDDYLTSIRESIADLGMSKPTWSVSEAIRGVITDTWGESPDWGAVGAFDQWTPYSQLSSVAHGMLPGLGSLMNVTTGEMVLPRQEAINHIGIVYGVADRTFDAMSRCSLPLIEPNAVDDIWAPIARCLEIRRIRLGQEDHEDLPRNAGPTTRS